MFTQEQTARLAAASANLAEAHAAGTLPHGVIESHLRYLKNSEGLALALLGVGTAPTGPGDLEFGAILYQMEAYLQHTHPLLWKVLKFFMDKFGIHASLDPTDFPALFTTGEIGGDGTLFAAPDVAKYAQLDPGWLVAVVEYLQLELGLKARFKPFPTQPKVVTVAATDTVTLALTGDWGSGLWGNGPWGHEDHGRSVPAMLVIDQIEAQAPAFTIHLGDVYYGGTFVEEKSNLLQSWCPGPSGTFTLNSNHEMYDGARGYFKIALQKGGVFNDQQGTSYFAIESDDWVIVGLDSAYYDTSRLFMDGALVDEAQCGFLAGYKDKPTVIVLTHHNPFNVAGTALVPNPDQGGLWDNVVKALGRAPDFWYWGHVHNGVAYNKLPADVDVSKTQGIVTKGRCLGHGALPFGNASDIVKDPSNVAYWAKTPMPNPVLPYQKLRVLNGWVHLTLGGGQLKEEFFEAGGTDPQPVWGLTHDLPTG